MLGSKATAVQTIHNSKKTNYVVRAVDEASGTCTIVFGSVLILVRPSTNSVWLIIGLLLGQFSTLWTCLSKFIY
jgi:hypothetical protein